MYNGPGERYYLIAIDRWGADLNALATVATSGSYNDLTNKPNIPTSVSQLTNDAGYVTAAEVPVQVNADWNATSGAAQILHKPNLAPVATSGSYNDLNNKPTIPTSVSQLTNDAGYITSAQVPAQTNADWNATSGAAQILHKPNLAPVATSGDYNDLNNKPTIPTVPTNISAFVNDAGYLTAIPDGMGGISVEADPIFSAWNKDYNDLTNKPTNATFGQGIVRTKVDNPADETNIEVTFANYELVSGGVVSLAFTRDVPASATLNINNKGAKTIYYHGAVLAANVIKAGDRCLFMYNSNAGRYYLIANDRWGADIDALATVAHTGSYNDLTDKPTLATVATTGNYNDLTGTPEIPTVNNAKLTIKQNGETLGTFTANQSSNKTVDITTPTLDDMQGLVNSSLAPLQEQLDSLHAALETTVFTCGTSKVKDYDGNEYNTVKIGSQCWLKENMRTTHYADGTFIPLGTDTNAAVAYRYAPVGNESNVAQYGYLYNWKAAMNGAASSNAIPSGVQGVCPTGWHVPSTEEKDLLFETLSSNSDYSCGGNPNYTAKAAASNVGWLGSFGCDVCDPCHDMATNNASGFSAMPAGGYLGISDEDLPPGASVMISNGYYILGLMSAMWCATYYPSDHSADAMGMMTTENPRFGDQYIPIEAAASVRCVRDVYEGYTPTINLHDELAEVAFTGDYNDLENRPTIPAAQVNADWNATSGVAQILHKPTIPTVNDATLTIQQNGTNVGTFTANQSTNQTVNITTLTSEQVQAMISDAVSTLQQQMDNLQDKYDSLQDKFDSLQDVIVDLHTATYKVPSSGTTTVNLDNTVIHLDVYDWGGPDGNYGNSWDGSLTFVANSSNKVFKITGSYQTETSFDTILIYNGTGAAGANTIVKLGGSGTISEPIYSVGNTITIRFRSDATVCSYAGFALSIDIVDKPSCTAAKAVDVQGNYYSTVKIGNQCWMKENLRTTKYANGTDIPSGGLSSTEPYYFDYSSSGIPLEQRGYLYNWPAVMHGASSSEANPSGVQGICPTGWHVPSYAEWTQLTNYVSSQSEYTCSGNNNIAKALAAPAWWNSSTTNCAVGNNPGSNNATGFSIVPAGGTNSEEFHSAGSIAHIWSSTQSFSDHAHYLQQSHDNAYVSIINCIWYAGSSVRCLRD